MIGTAIMVASSWWCERVRYPAFRTWSDEEFLRRHALHTFQISIFVVPGMLLQLAGTAAIWLSGGPGWYFWLNVLCCAGSIGPTLLVSGPIHGRLSGGKDPALIERLIRTNLPRTIVWSLQFALALAWFGFQTRH